MQERHEIVVQFRARSRCKFGDNPRDDEIGNLADEDEGDRDSNRLQVWIGSNQLDPIQRLVEVLLHPDDYLFRNVPLTGRC